MTGKCRIVGDLLPLYADNVCSEESRRLVERHASGCAECKKKLEAMTAQLPEAETKASEIKQGNVFRLLHRRYVRLIITTLLICAAFIIPGVICAVLTINEEANVGTSWSVLKMDRELRHFGEKLRQGKYCEALELIRLPNQEGYSENELAYFRELYAKDFEEYFAEHPIEKMNIWSKQTLDGGVSGNMYIAVAEQKDKDENIPVWHFAFDYDSKPVLHSSGLFFGNRFDPDDGNYTSNSAYEASAEEYKSCKSGFPDLMLISAEAAEQYFVSLDIDSERTCSELIGSDEFAETFGTEQWQETVEKYETLSRSFSGDYFLIDAKTVSIDYIRDEERGFYDRFYLIGAKLRFLCGTEIVTVSCKVPLSDCLYPKRLSAVRDISYSPNAPSEFRERFEEIFG